MLHWYVGNFKCDFIKHLISVSCITEKEFNPICNSCTLAFQCMVEYLHVPHRKCCCINIFICKISCLFPQTIFCGLEINRYLLMASALNQLPWFIIINGCSAINIKERWVTYLVTKLYFKVNFLLACCILEIPAVFYYNVYICVYLS